MKPEQPYITCFDCGRTKMLALFSPRKSGKPRRCLSCEESRVEMEKRRKAGAAGGVVAVCSSSMQEAQARLKNESAA